MSKRYFECNITTPESRDIVFASGTTAGEVSKGVKQSLTDIGITVKDIRVEEVPYTETMFSKQWTVNNLGTLKAEKAIKDGKHAVKFSVVNPDIEHITDDMTKMLHLPDDASVAEEWDNFEIEHALSFAYQLYDKLKSQMIRAPLEDTPDIIH